MTAKEAKQASDKNAKAIEMIEALEAKQKADAKVARHEKFRADKMASIRSGIKYDVEHGRSSHDVTLQSHSRRGPYSDPMYGEGFMKLSEYRDEWASIMKELNEDGYKTVIDGYTVSHENRNYGEYLGTSYTFDTILTVSW